MNRLPPETEQTIYAMALIKGKEKYVFLFDDAHRAELLRVLGRYASEPELSLSWYDAAALSERVRAGIVE